MRIHVRSALQVLTFDTEGRQLQALRGIMNRIGYLKRFTGLCPLTIVIAVLTLLLRASPASATGTCAQDLFTAAGNTQTLGCTAGDVSITGASNARDPSGNPLGTCIASQLFNVIVDFTVVSTSTKTRSNVGLYLGTIPVGQTGSSALTGTCDDNILSMPHLPGVATSCTLGTANCLGDNNYTELDGLATTVDNCGDAGAKTTHIVTVELDGVTCPAVGVSSVLLPDCTTWQVPGQTISCESNPGAGWPFVPSAAIPGTPSKCNCGQVSIPVVPISPSISEKKTVTPASVTEPGSANDFHYTAVTKNTTPGPVNVTINQLCDDKFGNIATATTSPAQNPCAPGTLCPAVCSGGTNNGTSCTSSSNCTGGGLCGACASNISCALPATLAQNATVTCTFDGTVRGTEPLTVMDTVTAKGIGAGAPLSAQDSISVSLGEAAAQAQVQKRLDTAQECETARYIVEVDNLSPMGTDESLTLTGTTPLNDSKFGDITMLGSKGVGLSVVGTTCGVANGQFGLGTMASGKLGALLATGNLTDSIPVGGNYTCEFDGQFCSGLGSITGCGTGLEVHNTVTASLALDGDGVCAGGTNAGNICTSNANCPSSTCILTLSRTGTLTVDSCFSHTP